MALDVPVAILVFNRPAPTAQLMSIIAEARPTRLFVIADAPRRDVPLDAERCRETLDTVESAIRWPTTVARNIATVNLGCRVRVESGLDWLFSQTDRAIILEDDCIPDPTFFEYCKELLTRYADCPHIGAIAGTSLMSGTNSAIPAPADENFVFSRYPLSWGWASWARAWALNDPSMLAWPSLRTTNWLNETLESKVAMAYWRSIFDASANGFDAWDYGWTLACWRNALLTIHPAVNLVSNVGFDALATHTRQPSRFAAMPTRPIGTPLSGPSRIERNVAYDEALEKLFFSGDLPNLFSRLRSAIATKHK